MGLLRGTMKIFPRRKRIRQLERLVRQNPSAGNYEELGELYLDDGKLVQARAAFDRAIAARSRHAGCVLQARAVRSEAGRCGGGDSRSRKGGGAGAGVRLLPRGRAAGARVCNDGAERARRGTVPAGDGAVGGVGDVFEFCRPAGVRR